MVELLTIDQTAERLQVHHHTVRRLIKDGRLKYYRPGRKYLIPVSSIMAFLESTAGGTPVKAEPNQGQSNV
jgi:excisionase family DNA binding protein